MIRPLTISPGFSTLALWVCSLVLVIPLVASGQSSWPADNYTTATLDELIDFVRIPNDALDIDDIRKNTAWAEAAFKRRGFTTRVLETSNTPLLLAELDSNAPETLLFYMHLDGQSVDPSMWNQDDPYEAVIKKQLDGQWVDAGAEQDSGPNPEWRVFGRSVSDDKGPIVMFLAAMDMLKDQGMDPTFNLKVVLDGEEERGSRQLPAAVQGVQGSACRRPHDH